MKQIHRAIFISILIPLITAGCVSLNIPEQKDPALSLMVLKVKVPEHFIMFRSSIVSNGESYSNTENRITTSDELKPQIFVNIPAGRYRLASIYAKTCHGCTSYIELNPDFKDTDKRTVKNDEWIELKPGSVKYAGLLEFVTIDKKDKRLAELGKSHNRTLQEVNKAIINESEMTGSKGKTNCIILRLDHPALVGELESLKIEKDLWNTLLDKISKDPETKWEQYFKNRIAEIDKEISHLREY